MGNSNSVFVQTERPAYGAGDTVRGCVYLNAQSDINATDVRLKFTCFEYAAFHVTRHRTRTGSDGKDRRESYEVEISEKRDMIKMYIPIHNFSGSTIPPGQYTFPFQFQLPPNCPGIFDAHGRDNHGSWRARIAYKLKAVVGVRGMFKSDIKYTAPLVVRPVPVGAAGSPPQRVDVSAPVTVCCCCDKGTAALSMTTDKTLYTTADTINVIADFRNQSTKPIGSIRCALSRCILLRARGSSRRVVTNVVTSAHPGVAAECESLGRYLPLSLVGSQVSPSTRGFLLECVYEVIVTGKISMGSNLHMRLPVVVTAADNWHAAAPVVRYDAAPPGWNAPPPDYQQQQPVTFQLPQIAAPTPAVAPYNQAPMGTADGGFSRIDDNDNNNNNNYNKHGGGYNNNGQQGYNNNNYGNNNGYNNNGYNSNNAAPPPASAPPGGPPPPSAPPAYNEAVSPKPKFDPYTGKPIA